VTEKPLQEHERDIPKIIAEVFCSIPIYGTSWNASILVLIDFDCVTKRFINSPRDECMKSFTDCLDSWALKLKAGTFCFEKSGSDFKSLVKSNFGAQWLETSDDELQALASLNRLSGVKTHILLPKIMILLNPDCKMLRKQQLWQAMRQLIAKTLTGSPTSKRVGTNLCYFFLRTER
jgi:hypothetical protein